MTEQELHASQVLSVASVDPIASARMAGLHYVSDDTPGIRRERQGDTFRYLDAKGRVIDDEAELQRFTSLGIPPAWEDVWICPRPNGHLQATGRDAKGRKQYRYHLRWRATRDETKYGRLLAFGRALPPSFAYWKRRLFASATVSTRARTSRMDSQRCAISM